MKLTATLTHADFRQMTAPGLYIWKRGDAYLYIGVSVRILARVANHNVIDRAESVLDGDIIEIYSFPEDANFMYEEEARLTRLYKPKYSKPIYEFGGDKTKRELVCMICKRKFMQTRPWQKFCSIACQSGRPK
jgi:predicted GIY-YIG superfamily endonuclease